jgi:hypothetical protein
VFLEETPRGKSYSEEYSSIVAPTNSVGRDTAVGITTLRGGRSGDRIPVEARFSASVQTGPGANLASIQWVPGLFPGDKARGAWI